jgi:hypothetical protein
MQQVLMRSLHLRTIVVLPPSGDFDNSILGMLGHRFSMCCAHRRGIDFLASVQAAKPQPGRNEKNLLLPAFLFILRTIFYSHGIGN